MLPVVDRPAIQYVVEEAVAAGLEDVLMITGRSKRALEDHFDRNAELEASLQAQGKDELLRAVQASNDLGTIHYVRQGDPRGLGHAVLCAAQHVGHEPFAVLLGDDLIDPRDQVLPRMLDVQARYGGSVVLLLEVPQEQVSLYGCAAVTATDEDDVVEVTGLVEKPDRADAPSNLALIGRYALDPAVFDVLRQTPTGPGRGDPADRRAADPGDHRRARATACGAWCSAAAATTPATGWTTSRPWSAWPRSATTWGRTSGPGWRSTSPAGGTRT